ncbi:MAG: hypothetical protein ACJA1C_000135 [Crocinitomicaceae bacterium]|jgi:hypothetical protein
MIKLLSTAAICLLTSFLFGQTISGVSPAFGERGTLQLPITISGTGTNFTNATSTVVQLIETGGNAQIEVVTVNSVSPQSVSFELKISNLAPLGNYTIRVYDGLLNDFVDLPNGFTVLSNSQAPVLSGTTPGNASVGQLLPITIIVDDANFDQATNNTIHLSQQGTSSIISAVPGSITVLNGHSIRAMFDFSHFSISAGSIMNSHCGNSFDGYFVDPASIVVTEPTSIAGDINYAGSFGGIVELYQENTNTVPSTYSLVSSSSVTGASNSYDFPNVAQASYLIRSVPIAVTDVVATYYPSNIAWQNATVVTTDPLVTGLSYDINPVNSLSVPGGVTVNGAIGYGPNGFNKTAVDVVAVGVEVFIKDMDNNLYAQTTTDANGEYSFVGLADGNYEIVIDLPGYNQTNTYTFTVDGTSSNLVGLDFLIDDGVIFTTSLILNLNPLTASNLDVYPNPTMGDLSIKIPSSLTNGTLEIYNQLGKRVWNEKITSNEVFNTNISTLSNGMYIVRIQGDQSISEMKLIKN